ncbi:Uncharacterised protein [Mycobacteroides abscessus subsp. abscessus]|nr:Uncharacterised protein [Mycobacteroides abscessus subsp. abscessus]
MAAAASVKTTPCVPSSVVVAVDSSWTVMWDLPWVEALGWTSTSGTSSDLNGTSCAAIPTSVPDYPGLAGRPLLRDMRRQSGELTGRVPHGPLYRARELGDRFSPGDTHLLIRTHSQRHLTGQHQHRCA